MLGRIFIKAVLSLTLGFLICASPSLADRPPPIAKGQRWHWQLKGKPSPSHPATVLDYDVDIYTERAGPDPHVKKLRDAGKEVICYFSTQYENWRADMKNLDKLKGRLVGNKLDDWPGERYLNVRDQRVRDIMVGRIVRAQKMGCTAVEPDNVDFYSSDAHTGFKLGKKDAISYLDFLSKAAHRVGLKIGLKNSDEIAAEVVNMFDFVVIEECARYKECDKYNSFPKSGKAALQAEYTQYNQATCDRALKNGFSLIFITNGTKKMNGDGVVPCLKSSGSRGGNRPGK